jgi:hypothetical protein
MMLREAHQALRLVPPGPARRWLQRLLLHGESAGQAAGNPDKNESKSSDAAGGRR